MATDTATAVPPPTGAGSTVSPRRSQVSPQADSPLAFAAPRFLLRPTSPQAACVSPSTLASSAGLGLSRQPLGLSPATFATEHGSTGDGSLELSFAEQPVAAAVAPCDASFMEPLPKLAKYEEYSPPPAAPRRRDTAKAASLGLWFAVLAVAAASASRAA